MEKIVTRPVGDLTEAEAREGLALAFPNARVASFLTDKDKKTGEDIFIATLVTAAPPPFADDAPPSDGPPDSPPEDEPVDDEKDDEKQKKPKSEKGGKEGEILDILKQMAQAMGLHVGEEEGMPKPPGEEGMEDAPPPPPVAEDAPLPPPAKPHGPGGGGGLGMPFSKNVSGANLDPQALEMKRQQLIREGHSPEEAEEVLRLLQHPSITQTEGPGIGRWAGVDKFAGDQHVASLRQETAGRRSFPVWYEDGDVPLKTAAEQVRDMFPDCKLLRIERKLAKVDGGEPQPIILAGMVRN